jgi:hypothetical protein
MVMGCLAVNIGEPACHLMLVRTVTGRVRSCHLLWSIVVKMVTGREDRPCRRIRGNCLGQFPILPGRWQRR